MLQRKVIVAFLLLAHRMVIQAVAAHPFAELLRSM
jgi:hypothetical protein